MKIVHCPSSIDNVKVLVAQLDSALASEANVEGVQPTENQKLTTSPESDTPIITPIESKFPPELQEIIDRWDNLPEHIREAIQALVKAYKRD